MHTYNHSYNEWQQSDRLGILHPIHFHDDAEDDDNDDDAEDHDDDIADDDMSN